MIRSRSWGSRLVAWACSHSSTAVAAAWSPGWTSTTSLGSWKRVADTTHLVGTDRPRGLGGRSSKRSQAPQVCPVPILRKLRRPPRPSARPLQPPGGKPVASASWTSRQGGQEAISWSLHSDRRCRVDLTLQMTVGEEFARLECGNGGAAASIVPPTIPSRLGRAADRPRRRPMPFQGVNLRANHLHRRRPVMRVGAMAWWTASSHWAWSWWRSGSYRHQSTRVQPNSSTNRQIRSPVLSVDLDGSRRIWPAHVGWVVDLVGSSTVPSDRLDDQTDDQARQHFH